MSLLALSLVVLAAFIHATWNLLSKRAADAGPTFVFAYNLFACLVYLPWMIWLLVYGELTWNLPVAACLVLSPCIHLAYSHCLQPGYQVADLSAVYPIARGTGPLLSSIGAFILLREIPSVQGILGLLAVVAGIGLITTQGDLSAFRRPRGLDGVRWGTATGSLIAGYTVVDAVSVLGTHLSEIIRRHAHELFSRQDAKRLIDRVAIEHPKVVGTLAGDDTCLVVSKDARDAAALARELATAIG